MKSLVVYYSFTGNTNKVAQNISMALKTRGEVVTQKLTPIKETKNFLAQCFQALTGKRPELIGKVNFDVSKYDVICIGTPVWAFAPTPAMNTFLDKLTGAIGKKAVLFTTFGSGAGVKRCVDKMKQTLSQKGVSDIKELNVQMDKVKDSVYVTKRIMDLGIFF